MLRFTIFIKHVLRVIYFINKNLRLSKLTSYFLFDSVLNPFTFWFSFEIFFCFCKHWEKIEMYQIDIIYQSLKSHLNCLINIKILVLAGNIVQTSAVIFHQMFWHIHGFPLYMKNTKNIFVLKPWNHTCTVP